jgi:hypothetical protein
LTKASKSKEKKLPKPLLLGPVRFHRETLDEMCNHDLKPLAPHKRCSSAVGLLPELQTKKEFMINLYDTRWSTVKCPNFMFAGPDVNLKKTKTKDPFTGEISYPVYTSTPKAFKQRFIDYNIMNRMAGEYNSAVLVVDIDDPGKLSQFYDLLKDNNLPIPLIVRNRTNDKFQGHFNFKVFQKSGDLVRIRFKINDICQAANIKADDKQFKTTRNGFFNPYKINKKSGEYEFDENSGELVFEAGYTNAKDRKKHELGGWQAHDAELILFADHKEFVELKDFEHLLVDAVDKMITTINKNLDKPVKVKKVKKEKKKSGKKAKTDENCQEYCFKKHKTRFPELHYLIDNPSKEQVGDRYDNMFPSIKSSFSKVCSIEINGKAWGVISREFEAKVRPMLRAAIKAQLPGHDDGYIDYLTDHMIRNTVDHMVNTWDPNLAGGNGSGRSEWAAKGWANHRAVVGECIMDYLDRFKGMSRKEFNHLRDQGNIVRKKDGNFAVKYLVKETDIRDQAKYTDQFYSDNDDNLILKTKKNKY